MAACTYQIRLDEQKLVSDRVAWMTPGLDEVDNEIRVVPRLPLSDTAIERKIREIKGVLGIELRAQFLAERSSP